MKKLTAYLMAVLLGIVFLFVNPTPAQADISSCSGENFITNPANGHKYCLTNPGKWSDAKTEGLAVGGNLVTINDQAEQDWLLQTFGNTNRFWLGFTDDNTEGNFNWASGATTPYTNWLPGEPNNGNCNADEHYAAMNWTETGSWNDLKNDGFWLDCSETSNFCGEENTPQIVPPICEPGFVALAGIVEIEPTGGVIQGTKWNDFNGDGSRDSGLETALANVQIYLDLNQNGALDAGEPTQVTGADGQYRFTGLQAGVYIVREINPTGFKQTYPAKSSTPGNGYADVVLGFYDSGAGPIPGPYGSSGGIPAVRVQGRYTIEPVNPNVVLGPPPPSPVIGRNPQVDWVSLPRGSFVTVGFNDEMIIDAPGDDIFIRSFDPQDSANENADIYVSANGTDFTFLGRVNERGLVKLDLASIGYTAPVKAVKVVGVDELGSAPGFDLVTVEGLPGSISSPDFHTVSLGEGATVENINFGNTAQ